MNTKPRFGNNKEAVAGLTQELEAIAAKFKMSVKKNAKFLTAVGVQTEMRRKKWHPEVVRQIY